MKNTNNSTYSEILKSIKTKDQAKEFSSNIDSLVDSLFGSGKQSLKEALNIIPIDYAQMITKLFLKEKLDTHNKEIVNETLMNLRDLLKEYKVIKLTLAFEPSAEMITNIHSWIIKNLGNGYILDIDKEENIMAGAFIAYDGKYEDQSLKKNLQETFRLNRSVILNELKDQSPKK